MSVICFFEGPLALTIFRKNKLIDELKIIDAAIDLKQIKYGYLLLFNTKPAEQELENLAKLLSSSSFGELEEYAQKFFESVQDNVFVSPRIGTTSPWSSKATDILKSAGSKSIQRIERIICYSFNGLLNQSVRAEIGDYIIDPMTENWVNNINELSLLFKQTKPANLNHIPINENGIEALDTADVEMGLALSHEEKKYLINVFKKLNRNPTDAELMMFAQANSEHCRHKIFNTKWMIDDEIMQHTLFGMIKHTYALNKQNTLVAYHDNSAVISGHDADRLLIDPQNNHYKLVKDRSEILLKVETHNHPTAISPYAGAATGSGGEIRDEAATGRGAKAKAGLTGFSVSNLNIPNHKKSWEQNFGKPKHIASALDIMLQAPIGAASYNNEFGRPALVGYFRVFEQIFSNGNNEQLFGYHKPIMIAGGLGAISHQQINKNEVPVGAKIIVLGGPALLIGLGGGAASSLNSGTSSEKLDFASVQRDNPEMQRRCQEVIDRCWSMGVNNPIASIHDVGAGGLSNAIPEILNDSQRGGLLDLRKIPCDEPGMSPMQIWCNEAQERFVLAIYADGLERFREHADREKCPFAVVGDVTVDRQLQLQDDLLQNTVIDLPLSVLFDDIPKHDRQAYSRPCFGSDENTDHVKIDKALANVLQHPSVASKSFLITIGDRTIGGLTYRDQMIGPWQVPVADSAITLTDYDGFVGETMAMGERAPVAVNNAPASGRLAVAEAITNIAAVPIGSIQNIKLSANWMAAANHPGEDVELFKTVHTVAMELCPKLGITIPVGKDSLSMKTAWQQEKEQNMIAPISLIISAFAPVYDVRLAVTPQLQVISEPTVLVLLDLGLGKNRLGGSILLQTMNKIGNQMPDLDDADLLTGFFNATQWLIKEEKLLAYHDRSDGGLITTCCEMAFASRIGITLDLSIEKDNEINTLFAEELGAVVQIKASDFETVKQIFADNGLPESSCCIIGSLNNEANLTIKNNNEIIYVNDLVRLQKMWSETSYLMQKMRDNPQSAKEEYQQIENWKTDPGLLIDTTFEVEQLGTFPYINNGTKPKIAILREQGINGHIEMAAAFHKVGFECVDVHMTDLKQDLISLGEFKGLVACGGFSYGDVLGAGSGWANSILFNKKLQEIFIQYFQRSDTFSLGVCNGCQMLSMLKNIIPGATHWPTFERNISEQFEARLSLVKIVNSPSIFFTNMEESKIPIAVAHGEGRAVFEHEMTEEVKNTICLQYINNDGTQAKQYPANPNGSEGAISAMTSLDGRATIMMPHPERVIRNVQLSIDVSNPSDYSPWLKMFQNARRWLN